MNSISIVPRWEIARLADRMTCYWIPTYDRLPEKEQSVQVMTFSGIFNAHIVHDCSYEDPVWVCDEENGAYLVGVMAWQPHPDIKKMRKKFVDHQYHQRDRQVVNMYFFEEMSAEQISKKTNLGLSTVRGVLAREIPKIGGNQNGK